MQIRKKQKLKSSLVLIVAFALLSGGIYLILLVLAPSVPILSGTSPDETVTKLKSVPGAHGDRLFIPRINVNVAIVQGPDESVLEKGAWHRKPENGNPADGGNYVLSAHRFLMGLTPQNTAKKSPFYHIDKMGLGDTLYVDYKKKRYKYTIEKKHSVQPNAINIEERTKEPQLTLYTCTLQGAADGRVVIVASPVETSD